MDHKLYIKTMKAHQAFESAAKGYYRNHDSFLPNGFGHGPEYSVLRISEGSFLKAAFRAARGALCPYTGDPQMPPEIVESLLRGYKWGLDNCEKYLGKVFPSDSE